MITLERLNYEVGYLTGFLRGLLTRNDVDEIHELIRKELKRLEDAE